MKIYRQYLKNLEATTFEEEVDFSSYEFDPTHIKAVPYCLTKAVVTDLGDGLLLVKLSIKAKVTGVCAYTLEDVPLEYEIKDEIYFTDKQEDEDDSCFYEEGNLIDLDPYILGIIFAEIPIKVVKPGAKLPSGGDGYSVVTEEEYLKEKSQRNKSCWGALNQLIDEADE